MSVSECQFEFLIGRERKVFKSDKVEASMVVEKKRNLLRFVVGLVAWVRLLSGVPLWECVTVHTLGKGENQYTYDNIG